MFAAKPSIDLYINIDSNLKQLLKRSNKLKKLALFY